MKNLKTLFMLGLFALVAMPLQAQPPPDYPPEEMFTGGDIDDVIDEGSFIWETRNETDCDIELDFWFHLTGGDFGSGGDHHLSGPVLANSQSSITNSGLMGVWGANFSTVTNIAAWLKFGSASGFMSIFPPGTTVMTGQSSPCDCFNYSFDFSQSGKAILRITRNSPPCP